MGDDAHATHRPPSRKDEPEERAHRALDAALDLMFERGRLAGLRDARDRPDQIDRMIVDTESWL